MGEPSPFKSGWKFKFGIEQGGACDIRSRAYSAALFERSTACSYKYKSVVFFCRLSRHGQ